MCEAQLMRREFKMHKCYEYTEKFRALAANIEQDLNEQTSKKQKLQEELAKVKKKRHQQLRTFLEK